MNTGRKIVAILVVLAVLVLTGVFYWIRLDNEKEAMRSVRIGISLYRIDDTFISDLRRHIEEYAKEYEKTNGIKVYLEIVDAADNQNEQDRQIERFVSLHYDALCINPVDRTDASGVIEMALSGNLPIIFFNRKPIEEDIMRSSQFYYIGSDAKETAILEGRILVDAYRKDPSTLDLNQDGKVNYVLLEGEPSHQDSIIRTEWIVKTLEAEGIPINKLDGGIANWERTQGAALMEKWLNTYPDQIEVVISNNDDMALGALDAIEEISSASRIKLVGIDGTPAARQAIEQGRLYGTVSVRKDEYARAILDIAIAKALKEDIPQDIRNRLINEKYFNVSHDIILQKNQ